VMSKDKKELKQQVQQLEAHISQLFNYINQGGDVNALSHHGGGAGGTGGTTTTSPPRKFTTNQQIRQLLPTSLLHVYDPVTIKHVEPTGVSYQFPISAQWNLIPLNTISSSNHPYITLFDPTSKKYKKEKDSHFYHQGELHLASGYYSITAVGTVIAGMCHRIKWSNKSGTVEVLGTSASGEFQKNRRYQTS